MNYEQFLEQMKEDLQASLSISLGYPKPEELPVTIADMMKKVVDEKEIKPGEGILHHKEGMDTFFSTFPDNVEFLITSL